MDVGFDASQLCAYSRNCRCRICLYRIKSAGLRAAPRGRRPRPALGELPPPDLWLLVEGVVAIVTGVMTILLVALHHPFRITRLVSLIGTFMGWWV